MAKARVVVNPMYEGGAGGYTFYTRDGEQIMRQRKNNSNYGESASRTLPQQLRRVKWANLVNMYKTMSFWQPKAYESRRRGQTDYNVFMSLNVNRSRVALTKDMAVSGCAVVDYLQVARGSLPEISATGVHIANHFRTNIVLSEDITSATTIAAISADIIANNPAWVNGDNLGCVLFYNYKDNRNYPYASTRYFELTLDTSNTSLLSSIPFGSRFARQQEGNIGPYLLCVTYQEDVNEVAASFIHTRKTSGGLQVSNAYVQFSGREFWDEFSGTAWELECAETYGIDTEVPLDPSFPEGAISLVTANGTLITPGAELSGSQTLRVYGNSVGSGAIRLVHDDQAFVPLSSTSEYQEYILGDNGSYSIYLGSSLYVAFSVTNITIPSDITNRRQMWMIDSNSSAINAQGRYNNVSKAVKCLQYHYVGGADAHFVARFVGVEDVPSLDDVKYTNCSYVSSTPYDKEQRINVVVTDKTAPAYISYKDFIIFVFNYTA